MPLFYLVGQLRHGVVCEDLVDERLEEVEEELLPRAGREDIGGHGAEHHFRHLAPGVQEVALRRLAILYGVQLHRVEQDTENKRLHDLLH